MELPLRIAFIPLELVGWGMRERKQRLLCYVHHDTRDIQKLANNAPKGKCEPQLEIHRRRLLQSSHPFSAQLNYARALICGLNLTPTMYSGCIFGPTGCFRLRQR